MSRSLTSRFAAQSFLRSHRAIPAVCRLQITRSISQTSPRLDDDADSKNPPSKPMPDRSVRLLESIYGTAPRQPSLLETRRNKQNAMANLSQSLILNSLTKSTIDTSALSSTGGLVENKPDALEPYHFHIYSHKHNTHITCTKPSREPIISLSCGNIGFRKSRRGTFDAAYSLTKYVLERLIHTGWPMKINRLEVNLRGFGQGREAALKVLMSPEGKVLRNKIVRVADSTRIKFAGTRSEKPRRLG